MQVDVVPSVAGDATVSNAYMLQRSCIDVTHTSPITRQQHSSERSKQALPVYLHEQGHQPVTEDHYLISGMLSQHNNSAVKADSTRTNTEIGMHWWHAAFAAAILTVHERMDVVLTPSNTQDTWHKLLISPSCSSFQLVASRMFLLSRDNHRRWNQKLAAIQTTILLSISLASKGNLSKICITNASLSIIYIILSMT